MASITLQGILLDSLGEIDVGAILKFTHLTTTGSTVAGTQVNLIVPPDGAYLINVEYGQIRVDYTSDRTERFVATVVVNSDSTATSIPELLNASVPPTNAQLLAFQTILAGAVAAEAGAVAAEAGAVAAKDIAVAASIIQYQTFAELEAISEAVDYTQYTVAERANAAYTLQPSGYVALAGDATLANGRVAALQDLENVRAYGTIADGVDCSAVIELATNSERSNKYNFRGAFKVDAPTLTSGISNLTLDCEGAYFDCSAMFGADVGNNPDALFKIFGSEFGSTTLAADAAINATTLVVADGTQIKLGSEIYILSDEHWYTQGGSVGRRFITTVKNISTNTITISDPLPFSFTFSGYTISVTSWNSIENINVIGGEFFGGNYRRNLGNGVGIGVVFCKYFRGLTIKGFTVNGFENIAYRPEFGKTAIIEEGTIQGHTNSFGTVTEGVNSGFYGVFFQAVLTGRMNKVTGTRCRHLQDSGSSFDLKVTDTTNYSSHRPAFGCHSGTFDTAYDNCASYGEIGGLQWRGFNLYANGFICRTGNTAANGIYDADGGAADLPSVRIIKNPDIIAGRTGIKLSGNISIAQITGGTAIGGAQSSAYMPVEIATDYIEYATVSTYMEQFSGSGICFYQSSSSIVNMKMIKIIDSYLKSSSNLARFQAGAGVGSVWIEQNVFDSSSSGNDIVITNTQIFERAVDNFRPDGTPATRN